MKGMAFLSTAVVNCGSAPLLDAIAAGTGTMMCLTWPVVVPPSAQGSFVRKDQFAGNSFVFSVTTANAQLTFDRATTNFSLSATIANAPTYQAGRWCWIAATFDVNGAAGDQQLWHGTLYEPMREVGAYAAQVIGSGAITDTSALNFLIGNEVAGSLPNIDNFIGFIGGWTRRLSVGELREQQQLIQEWLIDGAEPRFLSGCAIAVAPTAGGFVPDFSGNGSNGIATGVQTRQLPAPPGLYVPGANLIGQV